MAVLCICYQDKELDKDYRQNLVELTQMEREVAELRSQCTQLKENNEQLENGLKEVMEALNNAKHVPGNFS
jgi:chromosome segregation ATPase